MLKAFHARPEDTDLTKYAVRDDNFWSVSSISDFRPKNFDGSTSRKLLEFKVEWEIDKSKTWEPWSYVRKLQALRDYVHSTSCKNKVLKKLVPTNIIEEEVESDEEFNRELDAPYWRKPLGYKVSYSYMQSIFIVKDYNSIYVQSTTPLKSFISKREFLSLTPRQSFLEFLIPKEFFNLYIYKVNIFF